jgi:hypothetical protein
VGLKLDLNSFRFAAHKRKTKSILLAPPLPDGNWEVTPRPADALDDARITGSFRKPPDPNSDSISPGNP